MQFLRRVEYLFCFVSNAKIEKDIAKLTTNRSTYRSRISFDNIKNIVIYIYNIEYSVAKLDCAIKSDVMVT